MSYDERKAAQAAALLLQRAEGRLPLIKLLKLLYLAERLSFARYAQPLTGDSPVSMKNGPVLSQTYDHMKGALPCIDGGWDTWVKDEADYMVSLRQRFDHDYDLLDLSESDIEVLNEIWTQFGGMRRWDLVDYTHTLPEWEDPNGSSVPIGWQRLFRAIGYSPEAAAALEEQVRQQRQLDSQFA